MSNENEQRLDGDIGERGTVLSAEIRYAISQAAKATAEQHACVFNERQQDAVKHFEGMCHDIGGKDSSQGIEELRENSKHVSGVRSMGRSAKKYTWISFIGGSLTLLGSLLTWAGYAIWTALKAEIKG